MFRNQTSPFINFFAHHFTRAFLACSSLFVAQAIPLQAAPTLRYEIQTVSSLKITSHSKTINNAAVAASLKTKEGLAFSHALFNADLKKLALDYARVDPEIKQGATGLEIELKIWPKPTVRSIEWKGNEKITLKTLNKELGIKASDRFDRMVLLNAVNKVQTYYIKQGFFEAEVHYTTNQDPDDDQVDIQIEVTEGRSGSVQEIKFENFHPNEEEELLEMVATKQYQFFTSWITLAGRVSPDLLERDRLIVLKYLRDRGYADASVKIDIQEIPNSERVFIVITADKGACYRIGNITISGNKLFDEATIRHHFRLCTGSPYSPELLREALALITHEYGRQGYVETSIEHEEEAQADGLVYNLHLIIDEGKQYRVGLIHISGNCVTQDRVILHETLLLPGEPFNLDKLRATEARLLNIGYFKNVHIYAVPGAPSEGLSDEYRDVQIEVEETTTGHLGFSMGYSTAENVFCEAKITERNFSYLGLKNLLRGRFCGLRGGGEYANLSFTFGGKTNHYQLSWTKPFFMDSIWSVGFDIDYSNSRQIDEYDIIARGLTLHASYPMNAFMRFGCHYRIRQSHTKVHDHSKELKKETHIGGIISAAGVHWIYDSTDRPANPSCGFKSRVEFEVAGLGGNHKFLACGYLNNYYIPVYGNGVIQLRADFKFMHPYGGSTPHTLPMDERYFLGSQYTIRGFQPYRPGPQINQEPIGGVSLQFYSIEYSFPVYNRVEGFFYVDAGQLSHRRWAFGKLHAAAGFGVRLSILPSMPPLIVGYGYPIGHEEHSDTKRFFLTIGGYF